MAADVRSRLLAAARLRGPGAGTFLRPGLSAICSSAPRTTLQVVHCTTPANFFHVLRRQLKRAFRKPLISE